MLYHTLGEGLQVRDDDQSRNYFTVTTNINEVRELFIISKHNRTRNNSLKLRKAEKSS